MAMNKQLGIVLSVFIGVIVAVAFFQTIAQNVGDVTSTRTLTNSTYTAAANGENFYILNYKELASETITNATDGVIINDGNYTITNKAIDPTTGELSVKITVDSTEYESVDWNITATATPTDNVSGAPRSILSIILIIIVIGIIIFAIKIFANSDIFRRFR